MKLQKTENLGENLIATYLADKIEWITAMKIS